MDKGLFNLDSIRNSCDVFVKVLPFSQKQPPQQLSRPAQPHSSLMSRLPYKNQFLQLRIFWLGGLYKQVGVESEFRNVTDMADIHVYVKLEFWSK